MYFSPTVICIISHLLRLKAGWSERLRKSRRTENTSRGFWGGRVSVIFAIEIM